MLYPLLVAIIIVSLGGVGIWIGRAPLVRMLGGFFRQLTDAKEEAAQHFAQGYDEAGPQEALPRQEEPPTYAP